MKLFFDIILSPQALPYVGVLIAMVVGLIQTTCKSAKWKWVLLFLFEVTAITVSACLCMYYNRYSGSTYFGESVCALYGNFSFFILTLITLCIWRAKRTA